jgi:hypothetical protein
MKVFAMEKTRERKRSDAQDAKKREATIQMFKDRAERLNDQTKNVYVCMCGKKLGDEEMTNIAIGIHCNIGLVGKVKNQARWDYRIDGKILTSQDKERLRNYGLEILMGD